MERCKHAPQEQDGFARLTDEALGTVMAPFPWRKRTRQTEKAGTPAERYEEDRGSTGRRRGSRRARTKIFLQIITFNLLVPFIKTNVLGRCDPNNRTPIRMHAPVSVSPSCSIVYTVEAALNSRQTRTRATSTRETRVPRQWNAMVERNGPSWLLRGAPPRPPSSSSDTSSMSINIASISNGDRIRIYTQRSEEESIAEYRGHRQGREGETAEAKEIEKEEHGGRSTP